MPSAEYILPALSLKAFNCPRCRVYAKQTWYYMSGATSSNGSGRIYENKEFLVSRCESCNEPTIWHGDAMIYPLSSTAEAASEDLPTDVRLDFEEARTIASFSPRGAAALLRLAIQKLCAHLGQAGRNINADIAALVAAGLPQKVQQALDSVRVIGNDAVHPGTIDLKDDIATVNKLFKLVNFIAYKMITEPAEVDAIYNGLPIDKLAGITKRDGK